MTRQFTARREETRNIAISAVKRIAQKESVSTIIGVGAVLTVERKGSRVLVNGEDKGTCRDLLNNNSFAKVVLGWLRESGDHNTDAIYIEVEKGDKWGNGREVEVYTVEEAPQNASESKEEETTQEASIEQAEAQESASESKVEKTFKVGHTYIIRNRETGKAEKLGTVEERWGKTVKWVKVSGKSHPYLSIDGVEVAFMGEHKMRADEEVA